MNLFKVILDKMRQIRNFFLERVILRYFIFFMFLFGSWLILVVSGLLSPARQVYSASDLTTEQVFANGTGSVELKKQIYSKKNQMLLLNFETKAQGDTEINPKNLTWKIYSKNRNSKISMEVIPILNNKITVLVKNVPQNFDAVAISIINRGTTADNISVDLAESSSSSTTISSSKSKKTKDYVQFLITTRGKKLTYKTLGQLDRTKLASSEVDREIKFQEDQKVKLQKAIKNLQTLIRDDKEKIKELEKDQIYLTSDQKEDNLSQIDQLNSDIDNYQQNISKARENIDTVGVRIKMLEKKKAAIEAGTFEFSNPIKVAHTK